MTGKRSSREKLISFRVSEAEYEVITGLAARNELKVSEYLRKRALGGEIVQPKLSKAKMQEIVQVLHRIQAELGHHGGNIHQIARYLRLESSQSGFKPSEVLLSMKKKIHALEGEYGRFRDDVGIVWQLLGK
ncbi:plasmid mobilization protein [Streptococcus suis]|uniref:plasmid mobilization protein n=2 Tax=Streptococcus suis TaxID=1307 RepID=UPI000CF5971C|nr:hypothetical protein [Streptococcus suis]